MRHPPGLLPLVPICCPLAHLACSGISTALPGEVLAIATTSHHVTTLSWPQASSVHQLSLHFCNTPSGTHGDVLALYMSDTEYWQPGTMTQTHPLFFPLPTVVGPAPYQTQSSGRIVLTTGYTWKAEQEPQYSQVPHTYLGHLLFIHPALNLTPARVTQKSEGAQHSLLISCRDQERFPPFPPPCGAGSLLSCTPSHTRY